ncbi:SAM-dependent methyltransferase [Streptomyces sp. NPDC005498]|uniref:SAM-dependent methyltransferase n=1 Tax=Streptomyces sp. NPDC005498 TaxID=3364717 RepID=UPI00367B92A7
MSSDGTTSRFAADVALTALLVAAARAIETGRPAGLISDPYAEPFVKAAQTPVPLPTSIEDVEEGDADPVWGRGGQYFALRTRVFDDFLTEVTRDGIRQVVLLGAGLDTRALRLDWPAGTVLYEVDRPELFAFKQEVLTATGAEAVIGHRQVAADLAGDWAIALRTSGFDPARPTAWVLEGVLPYLSAAVEQRLISTVSELSATDSAIGYEILQGQETDEVRNSSIYEDTERKMGVHLSELFDADGRPDSARALGEAGWEMSGDSVYHFTEWYGRGPRPGTDDAIAHARWIRGRRVDLPRTI